MFAELEIKDLTGEVKDIDTTGRRVTGYLSKFGNVDHDNDIIEAGAFKKSVNERFNSIFFLNQHNWKQPHGKFAVLKEDSYGLYFESEKLPDTTYSNDALKLYEAGIVKEHSIGFAVMKSGWQGKEWESTRIIKEVKLFEGSNVTLGANSDTPFLGFKSLEMTDIKDRSNNIVKALRNGTFTDETFGLLEIALKQMQLQAYELGKQSLKDGEPLINTHRGIEPITIDTITEFRNQLNLS